MPSGSGPTSPTPSSEPSTSPAPSMLRSISHDPTSYVQRARVTRAAPPKPATNPMQFVQLKPCNLYQTAQEQLKRAEEVKKVKEVKKEDPEDWQCNLDNWKSSRRKRVEHIIDRVVEVKKYENMEEHERTRRKAKTFSEMLEERGSRGCKVPLPVYIEDDSNDFSDLGIGTSSASGKSSLSEDFDNHSVISDSQETEKSQLDIDNLSVNDNNGHRDYVSSPGYETSSSTAPASSPDPSEYTYEGAIQDYKLRISRAQAGCFGGISTSYNKNVTDTKPIAKNFVVKRQPGTKIEDRLLNFEVKGAADSNESSVKKDLPKVDILKRRELFEKENSDKLESNGTASNRLSGEFQNARSIKERMSSLVEKRIDDATDAETAAAKKANRLSGDITAIKERLNILEKQTSVVEKSKIDVPVGPLKDRLSSLNAHKEDEYPKDSYLLDFKTPHSYERNVVFNSADGFINGNKLYDVTTPTESITSKSEVSDDFSELIQEQQQQAPPPPQPPVIMAEELKRVEQTEIITKPEIVDMIPLNIQTEQSNQVEDIDELLSPDELDQEDSVSQSISEASQTVVVEGKQINSFNKNIINNNHVITNPLKVEETNIVLSNKNNSTSSVDKSMRQLKLSIIEPKQVNFCESTEFIEPIEYIENNEIIEFVDTTEPLQQRLYPTLNKIKESMDLEKPINVEKLSPINQVKPSSMPSSSLSITYKNNDMIDTRPQLNLSTFDDPYAPRQKFSQITPLSIPSPPADKKLSSSQNVPPIKSPLSPMKRTIFDFIRQNILGETPPTTPKELSSSSTFYVPLDLSNMNTNEHHQPQIIDVKQKVTKTNSVESSFSMNSEIDKLLDEELAKI